MEAVKLGILWWRKPFHWPIARWCTSASLVGVVAWYYRYRNRFIRGTLPINSLMNCRRNSFTSQLLSVSLTDTISMVEFLCVYWMCQMNSLPSTSIWLQLKKNLKQLKNYNHPHFKTQYTNSNLILCNPTKLRSYFLFL